MPCLAWRNQHMASWCLETSAKLSREWERSRHSRRHSSEANGNWDRFHKRKFRRKTRKAKRSFASKSRKLFCKKPVFAQFMYENFCYLKVIKISFQHSTKSLFHNKSYRFMQAKYWDNICVLRNENFNMKSFTCKELMCIVVWEDVSWGYREKDSVLIKFSNCPNYLTLPHSLIFFNTMEVCFSLCFLLEPRFFFNLVSFVSIFTHYSANLIVSFYFNKYQGVIVYDSNSTALKVNHLCANFSVYTSEKMLLPNSNPVRLCLCGVNSPSYAFPQQVEFVIDSNASKVDGSVSTKQMFIIKILVHMHWFLADEKSKLW